MQTLQVVVDNTLAPEDLLKAGVKLRLAGFPGKTRMGRASIFASEIQVVGLLPHLVQPSLLHSLLSHCSTGLVSSAELHQWLQVSLEELEEVLDEPDGRSRLQFCSRHTRVLRRGRDRVQRRRPARLSSEQWKVLDKYHGWSDLLVNEMVPAEALQLDTEDLPDPASNLGSRRWLLDFAVRKKRPQVRFMTKLFKNLVQEAHLVGLKITEVHDVGGGRGDLALAVSSALPRLQVHVWESFGPSVAHGRARAKDLDLNLRFLESSATALKSFRLTTASAAILALHACGGLSDLAFDACQRRQAPFCICPCCYKSLPHLRSETTPELLVLQSLAENDGLPADIADSAAFAINALRLQRLDGDSTDLFEPRLPKSWKVSAYCFPKEWSSRNIVLCGYPRSKKEQGRRVFLCAAASGAIQVSQDAPSNVSLFVL
ncbi:unnamed protein product [Durusdinium trenchii]